MTVNEINNYNTLTSIYNHSPPKDSYLLYQLTLEKQKLLKLYGIHTSLKKGHAELTKTFK